MMSGLRCEELTDEIQALTGRVGDTKHIAFSEHLIMSGFNYVYGIAAADITGDGSLDLVVADAGTGLYWFENDGSGHFMRHTIHIRTDEFLERHAIADINGDGQPEIVIVDNLNGSLLCFEYNGDPRDCRSWTYHYITEGGLPGAYDVTIADLDGDGDLDVAASSWRKGNRFVWFENKDGQWVQHGVEDDIAETRTICAADIDGDGKMDLLGTALVGNQVVWYENPGDPVHEPWKKHVIDTVPQPTHGHPVDMDGDGDMDVVMALGMKGTLLHSEETVHHQIVWYENDGHPTRVPWRKHIICASFPNAFEAVAADLDGDGNMEVVATAWRNQGRLAVFKHQGNPRGPWSMQILKAHWNRANQVFVADLNGNGRLDIVASAEQGSNELRWWRNEGAIGSG